MDKKFLTAVVVALQLTGNGLGVTPCWAANDEEIAEQVKPSSFQVEDNLQIIPASIKDQFSTETRKTRALLQQLTASEEAVLDGESPGSQRTAKALIQKTHKKIIDEVIRLRSEVKALEEQNDSVQKISLELSKKEQAIGALKKVILEERKQTLEIEAKLENFLNEKEARAKTQQQAKAQIEKAGKSELTLLKQRKALVSEVKRLRKIVADDKEQSVQAPVDNKAEEALKSKEMQLKETELALAKEKDALAQLRKKLENGEEFKKQLALEKELREALNYQTRRANNLEQERENLEGSVVALKRFSASRRKHSQELLSKELHNQDLEHKLRDQKAIQLENELLKEELIRKKNELIQLQQAAEQYFNAGESEDIGIQAPQQEQVIAQHNTIHAPSHSGQHAQAGIQRGRLSQIDGF